MATETGVIHPALSAFLAAHRHSSGGSRPIAVFDCDGTVIKGDIGEAMFHRQIERFWFRVSPASVWPDHPAAAEIDRLYRTLQGMPEHSRAGSVEFSAFADYLISWYVDQIRDGLIAKACTDIVRLFSGFAREDVRSLARTTWEIELASPLGSRSLGSASVTSGIRYLRPAIRLFDELQRRQFDLWVISGSNQWSVEAVFEPLGVRADRIIGIDLLERDGVLTAEEETPVPIREDKVAAFRRRTAERPLLVASDSKNDIPLFLDARELRVRINSRNRDTDDFFRSLGVPPDSSWVSIERPEIIEQMEFPWQMQP